MKTQHTPAPWTVGEYDENELAVVTTEHTVALLDQAYFCKRLSPSECIANAQLIAAAPEMLAALEKLLSVIDTHLSASDKMHAFNRFAVVEAEQALAKAKPKSSR